jgi:alpha-2-macroglobulin
MEDREQRKWHLAPFWPASPLWLAFGWRHWSAFQPARTTVCRATLLLLLLVAAFPLPSQEDNEPYFGLNSNQTFAEGDSPTIGLWATNVRELAFRVYRIEDPIAFFANLEEPHRFGGQAPRPPAPRTAVESFHRWKVSARNRIRNWFRTQYGTADRAAIRAWLMGDGAPDSLPKPAQFAQLPVLNSQQLVASWTQPVQVSQRWQSATVPVPVSERGLYLVEAVAGELSAHTIVIVSNIALTAKFSDGELLGMVVERQSGQPVEGARLHAIASRVSVASWPTDGSGLVRQTLNNVETGGGEMLLVAVNGSDVAATSVGSWILDRAERENFRSYIYTDRPVYRPGDKVYFKGIVRQENPDGFTVPTQRTAKVTVQNNRGERVYEQDHVVSNWGTFHGDVTLASGAPLGYYSVQIALGPYPLSGGFHVEEYRKPEYEVRVRPREPFVLQGQTAQAEVEARYFYGEPVANATVEWVAYSQRYHHWFRDGDSPFYDPFAEDGAGFFGGEVGQGTATLDSDGKALLQVPLRLSNLGHDERVVVQAKVRDAANRDIAGTASFVATYGNFHLSMERTKWVYRPGEEVGFTVRTRRYQGDPVQANVTVTLERRTQQEGRTTTTTVRTVPVRTGADGRASGSVALGESGAFVLVASASDSMGRRLRTEHFLWVTGNEGWTWTDSNRIEIIPDKPSYQPGDTAEVLIIAGAPQVPVLVTVEAGRIYRQEVLPAADGAVRYRLPIRRELRTQRFRLGSLPAQQPVLHGLPKAVCAGQQSEA